jgi:hypothetical protein
MGTSTNQPSPRRDPSWMAARAALGSTVLPLERQSQEIWRAAISDPIADLQNSLSSSAVSAAVGIANASPDPQSAIRAFGERLLKNAEASLFTEIARRALTRALLANKGGQGFAAELFAETAAYYVSRDLPSVIGSPGRVQNTSSAMALKRAFTDVARSAALGAAQESPIFGVSDRPSAGAWKAYVRRVLAALVGESP